MLQSNVKELVRMKKKLKEGNSYRKSQTSEVQD